MFYSTADLPNDWSKVVPGDMNLDTSCLDVIETAKIQDIQPVYILVYQHQQVIACLYAQVLRLRKSHIQCDDRFLRLGSRFLLDCIPLRLLVFGHLFRHDGSYIYIKPEIKNPAHILVQIVDQVLKKIKPTAYFLKDIPEHLQMIFASDQKYHRFANDVSMKLTIRDDWKTFDDYENALKKKYRQRAVKTRAAFEKVSTRVLSLEDIKKEENQIFALYEQVTANQSITLGKLTPQYFTEFKKQMGDRLEVLGYYYEDRLIAFGTALVGNGMYDMNYIGFDYTLNATLQLYFNMLFSFLERAMALGCHTLVLGRTALEAKAILGATAKQVYSFYQIKNPIINSFTAFVVKRMALEQGNEWQIRQPFK